MSTHTNSNIISILPGAEPFFYPGNRIGCLTLHGMTGTPFEVRWLGQHLNQQGWTVYGPRLAGHGTTPDDLKHVHWREWVADVMAGYELLRQHCDQIFVMGLSMGGALALMLASQVPVAGVVTLSAVYDMPILQHPLLPIMSRLVDRVAKARDPEARQKFLEHVRAEQIKRGEEPIPRPGYDVWVLPAMRQMRDMLRVLHERLHLVVAPALLVHSKADQTVTFDNLDKIYNSIGSTDKRCLVLERSGHVCTEDIEYPQVFEAVTEFVRAVVS
ncbi:MAG TPA: alpha/beta fold hydrolase [Aggregatilineales bacterium]|jgi:carboxylesterase|nr:alpha/beta fold hydrolase [Chloroflexota bacterium]HOA23091.1 alpha/beta fold hydrolase [Aggregatilineales bacterium]HPV06709.1 alpha/beta fold hydrolase [Aggregatilineales bacterium]HQA68951.1 alpha/beta fold hydrolase [Aggregatilineales bacterium]HQE17167.1 alpha/beta fold hydrolase [Aggregatilineales bacterium]